MGVWPLPQRVSTFIGAILLGLYFLRADVLFFVGFVLFGLVGLGPTALKSVRLSRRELALTFRAQSKQVVAALDQKAEEVSGSIDERRVSPGANTPTPPRVTGKDADVLRRVADALDAAPPITPAEFVNALAQAVAAVVSNPTLRLGESDQIGGDITITEPQAGFFADGDTVIVSLEAPSVTFSRPPWATVNSSDLKLRAGAAAASSSAAKLADDRREASWIVFSRSISPAVITISGLSFNVSHNATIGPLHVAVRVGNFGRRLVTGIITANE